MLLPLLTALAGGHVRGQSKDQESASQRLAAVRRFPPPPPKVAYRIPLASFGYLPHTTAQTMYGQALVSLDFIDPDRLLFTFNRRALLERREPCNGALDNDQSVRAVVIHLPDGHALDETDWQFSDHSQYLWPIGNGEFLLRRCRGLDLLQNGLEDSRLVNLPARALVVQTSAEGDRVLVEIEHERHTPEEHESLLHKALTSSAPFPAEDVDVFLLGLHPFQELSRSRQRSTFVLPSTDEGYLGILPADARHPAEPAKWTVAMQPFTGEGPKPLATVNSVCTPAVFTLSHDAFLAATCTSGGYHQIHVFNMEGKQLWMDDWESNLTYPHVALAHNGTRFAISTMHTMMATQNFARREDSAAESEDVSVYNTHDGKLMMTTHVAPPYGTGENFALSDDGTKFAALNGGNIEVFDLPAEH